MPVADFPVWTLLSFPALVLAIAVFPMLIPHLWEKRSLVKTYGRRGTLHLLPAAELPLWMAAMQARTTRRWR